MQWARAVPDDFDALLVLGPKQSYGEEQLKALDAFVQQDAGLVDLDEHTVSAEVTGFSVFVVLPRDPDNLERLVDMVRRCHRDGCDLLGMTAMPEAALARELDMQYASLCTVVNWAAGLTGSPITLGEIYQTLSLVRPHLRSLLVSAIRSLA